MDLNPQRRSARRDRATSAVPDASLAQQHRLADHGFVIGACGAGIGLFLLAVSPFFKWVNIATGGVIGLLSGHGKIVLGTTMVAIAVYIAAIATRRWLAPVLLGIQAWATLIVFWMGALIWRVGSGVTSSAETRTTPFGALLATQISPGIGLYVGLVGSIMVAGFLGFVALRRSLTSGSLRPYLTTQTLSCLLGISLAFFIGPYVPSKNGTATLDRLSPAEKGTADRPKEPREWYRAQWVRGYSHSRELDEHFGSNKYTLRIALWVNTEPDVPIKELYGHLVFVKDNNILYECQVAEKPDVSFKDGCPLIITLDPYDDNNATHRTLRYSKDSELEPVFTVKRVVLADGTEKTFD